MRILVLTKPVPDPGGERRAARARTSGSTAPPRPPSSTATTSTRLEAALQLVEAHGGEVAILTMAPANGTETMRKALAMGAHARASSSTDDALAGADIPTTIRVLAAAAATEEFDLLLGGLDTSDGAGGAVTAGVAARLGLPLLSAAGADRARPGRRHAFACTASPPRATTCVEAPMPAVISCTQALGTPRYPSLKGIMAARTAADRHALARGPRRRPGARRTALGRATVLGVEPPPARAARTRDHGRRPPTRPARSPTSSPTRRII